MLRQELRIRLSASFSVLLSIPERPFVRCRRHERFLRSSPSLYGTFVSSRDHELFHLLQVTGCRQGSCYAACGRQK
ncbi:hypothetical protein BD311DRAFT_752728 [Dichomitus squalens]|uniref:Uncharacterized protein n=1 Tax=Dichomitus squalens TaxID=114155 RepID=A0A4Q9MY46_9APHY|nr:hypothetical protein BD311DRAFT_752728 [Dichomitus squalens]